MQHSARLEDAVRAVCKAVVAAAAPISAIIEYRRSVLSVAPTSAVFAAYRITNSCRSWRPRSVRAWRDPGSVQLGILCIYSSIVFACDRVSWKSSLDCKLLVRAHRLERKLSDLVDMKRKDVSVNTSTGSDGGSSSRLGDSCTSLKLPGAAQSASSLETIDGVPVRMLESYIIVQDAFTFVYGCL